MDYLGKHVQVVLESLRMASIISFTFREAVADVEYKGKGKRAKRNAILFKFSLKIIKMIFEFCEMTWNRILDSKRLESDAFVQKHPS